MKESEVRPKELFNQYLRLARQDAQRLLLDRGNFIEISCPACACEDRSLAFEKLGFRWMSCAHCATLFISPRPTPEQLLGFYRDGESVKFWSTEFYRQTAEARREKMFRPRARIVSELAGKEGYGHEATFVDVGAGYGILLEEIRKLNLFTDIVGVEPGPVMAEICRERGFRVLQKVAEDALPGDCQADVATAFEVIEHVFDPYLFLTGICRLMRPGGRLLLTTLTSDGFDIQVLWEHSNSAHPPHHLNLLSVKGMESLLARAGLKLTELSTPGELDLDIISNMVQECPGLTVPRFVMRMLKSCGDGARRQFQSFLQQNRLSSHMRVVAVR